MSIQSSNIWPKLFFVTLICFSFVNYHTAPANAAAKAKISRQAIANGKDWAQFCKKESDPRYCCENFDRVHSNLCQEMLDDGIIDQAGYQKCLNDAADAKSICLKGVSEFITTPPSIGENPLELAPTFPEIRNQKATPHNKLRLR